MERLESVVRNDAGEALRYQDIIHGTGHESITIRQNHVHCVLCRIFGMVLYTFGDSQKRIF